MAAAAAASLGSSFTVISSPSSANSSALRSKRERSVNASEMGGSVARVGRS